MSVPYKDQVALEEDFSPGTNVVVGFNGAGKSNFFQAILFVLTSFLLIGQSSVNVST